MCIISFHLQEHPIYKLILIANRDERYARPTEKVHFWKDSPDILAGRDLEAMGTWMGITKQGRFAALTNYRNPLEEIPAVESRGNIVTAYLKGNDKAEDFLTQLQKNRDHYNGFNLLVGTPDELYFYNKLDNKIAKIEPGTHSVSNASLNTPWPKVEKARKRLRDYSLYNKNIQSEILFKQLYDDIEADESALPNTGISQVLEKKLSPIFIRTKSYGTRSSTILLVTHDNQVTFMERTFEEGLPRYPIIKKQFQIEQSSLLR